MMVKGGSEALGPFTADFADGADDERAFLIPGSVPAL